MIDRQVLPASLHRGESTHGHTADSVGGEQCPQLLALLALEAESDILERSLLRAQSGSLAGGGE